MRAARLKSFKDAEEKNRLLQIEENERAKMTSQIEVECVIHLGEFNLEEGIKMDSCNHCYCFCCLSHFFKKKIDEGITRNFTCLHYKCETEFTQDDILMCLD